jgi:HEAT repeat protein
VRLARPDAEAALLQALAAGPVPARRAAAEAMRLLRSPEVVAALATASVGDPDASVRRVAALALEG